MKFNETVFQSQREHFRSIPVNIEELETYLIWKPIEDALQVLRKKEEDVRGSIISIDQVKEMIMEELQIEKREDLSFVKKDLHSEISYIQNYQITNPAVAIVKLAKLYILEKGKDALSLISEDDYIKGTSKREKENQIKKINEEMAKLKKLQPKYLGMKFKCEDYITMWKAIAPRFFDECDAGGRWLNPQEPELKRLLNVYNKLQLGTIGKIRVDYLLKIDGKEYLVPPAYGSPLWKTKKERMIPESTEENILF